MGTVEVFNVIFDTLAKAKIADFEKLHDTKLKSEIIGEFREHQNSIDIYGKSISARVVTRDHALRLTQEFVILSIDDLFNRPICQVISRISNMIDDYLGLL